MFKTPYDDQTRASALNMLHTAGYPSQRGALTAVSRATGIPTATLRRWVIALPGDNPLIAPLAGVGPLSLTPGPSPHSGARGDQIRLSPLAPARQHRARCARGEGGGGVRDIPGAIRAELLATLRSMAAARSEASYKELSAGFGVLAEKLRQLEPAPDESSESGPGEAKERLAQLVGEAQPDPQAEA